MFVEVNRVAALVMDLSGGPPVGVPLEAWIQAVAPWPAVIFVPEAAKEYERIAPLALIREGNPAQLYADMAFPVRAAVKCALKKLGLPPCECVFVSSSPRAVVQAAGAHVGTVLLAPRGPMDELPDFIVESPDELQGVLRGDIGGYLGELEAACHAFDGFPRPKYALLALVSRPALDSLGVKAVATGRYFASADHRHRKHPLTRYILDAKGRLLDRPRGALVAA